jgi:hypothetical protein
MTELEKETIVACVGAAFSGVPAVLLFWWTWRRDQERLIVQKVIDHYPQLGGGQVIAKDQSGIPLMDVLIRNRSLFPVRVGAVGFKIDKTVIQLETLDWPVKVKKNPAPYTVLSEVPDDLDPSELRPGESIRIALSDMADRNALCRAITSTCEKYKMTPEKLVWSCRVKALVALESGRQFSSLPFTALVRRIAFEPIVTSFRRLKRRNAGGCSPLM